MSRQRSAIGRSRPLPRHVVRHALVPVLLITTVTQAGTVSEKVTRRSAVVRVVEEVKQAVVNISTTQLAIRRDPFFEEFFGSFFEPRQRVENRASLGSGIVVDPGGLVVTNAHVVAGAHRIFVGLEEEDEATFPADLLGVDATADLAVLRIAAGRKLTWIDLSEGSPAMIGETVIAIGNPFGLSHTVTVGVVSALDRSIRTNDAVYHRFLQTDASINPGNSGGALVDNRGRMIGINTAIFSQSGGNMGIGFAIPSNLAAGVVEQLIQDGEVSRGYLGVLLGEVTPELASALGVEQDGALIHEVVADSPADRGGLKAGDVITKLEGKSVSNAAALRLMVGGTRPGTDVRFAVVRDGESKEIPVSIGRLGPDGGVATAIPGAPGGQGDRPDAFIAGVELAELTDRTRRELGLDNSVEGVLIAQIRPDSPAAEVGLRPGDVITEVARQPVRSVDEAIAARAANSRDTLLLRVHNKSGSRFVAVETASR